jgi:subtilisin family serine protease
MVSNNEPYGSLSGTSQATSFVTLAAGLLLAKNNLLPAQAVKNRILDTLEMDPDTLKLTSKNAQRTYNHASDRLAELVVWNSPFVVTSARPGRIRRTSSGDHCC